MSFIPQSQLPLAEPIGQVWGAKKESAQGRLGIFQETGQFTQSISRFNLLGIIGLMSVPTNSINPNMEPKTEISLKAKALAIIHRDTSIPRHLRLKTGKVRELANGVFIKKRKDGVLELYVSEE